MVRTRSGKGSKRDTSKKAAPKIIEVTQTHCKMDSESKDNVVRKLAKDVLQLLKGRMNDRGKKTEMKDLWTNPRTKSLI
ncbi:hypothetical protein PIB30_092175 [Stylosanthes scabra]|uniref:Uncharacterized protein n=1 Tax=Stylosanthes scabra TaxID=79078 RepID=A0ABU6WT43_9FABA|nr:hypothetical protein [Stylosanthes scabra]